MGGEHLKRILIVLVCVMFPLIAFGQRSDGNLSPQELEGKGLFRQRCAVCHQSLIVGVVNGQPVLLTTKTYGPLLYKDLVIGEEPAIRQKIMQGSDRMPGFQYGLKPNEIDAIIAYLKTVDKVSQQGNSKATVNPD